jgi:hypothetical protein
MGLTIHYDLKSDAGTPERARQLVEELRDAALKSPFAEVGAVVEFTGAECDFRSTTPRPGDRQEKYDDY